MKSLRLLSLAAVVLMNWSVNGRTQDMPKPGPEQERLKQFVGTWDAHVKTTFEPGKPAQESKGVYVAKLDVAGFFLITDFKGEIMGAKFHGHGITGYDPHKKKYTGVWVDSMSPSLFHSEGAFDSSGKILTETMQGPDPKGNVMKMRIVNEVKNADHVQFRMFAQGADGKEVQMMEIAYTRKK